MTDDFIDDFIKEYQQQPCLWKASCIDFKNRKKRQEAYLKLIDIATQHGETYNIERTKQKINNLRCAFRVQLKKYTDFKNNPKSNKDDTTTTPTAYCPKRKYMESLMFLINEEKPPTRRRKSSNTDLDDTQQKQHTTNKIRRKIDKELDAITMSLGSDLEDNNLEQQINSDKLEFVEVETNHLINKDIKEELSIDNNSENDTLKIEEGPPITTTTTIALNDDKLPLKNPSDDDEGIVLWSQQCHVTTSPPIIEMKMKPKIESQKYNITTSTPIVQTARVLDVRTVKQPISRSNTNVSQQKKNAHVVLKPPQTPVSHHQTRSTDNKVITVLPPSKNLPAKKIMKPSVVTTTSNNNINNSPIINHNNINNEITSQSTSSSSIIGGGGGGTEVDHVKIRCDSNNFENLLTLACSRITQIADTEDDYGVFGKMVTCKLRGMDNQQALIAQKLISNILFDGQLKVLELPIRISNNGTSSSLMTQQLHSTTIRPIRNTMAGQQQQQQQTYYISGMNNGTTATSTTTDDATAQLFNTSSGDTHVHILGK